MNDNTHQSYVGSDGATKHEEDPKETNGNAVGRKHKCTKFLDKSTSEENPVQELPLICVEQASMVSAFPCATEDPVYTPPGEESTPVGSMDEQSLTSPSDTGRLSNLYANRLEKPKSNKKKKSAWYLPSVTCIPIFIILLLIGMVVMVPIILDKQKYTHQGQNKTACKDPCFISLVESIPQNLTYPKGSPSHPSVFEGWMNLLEMAESSIKIASSYWSLRSIDVPDEGTNTSWQGDEIFKKLFNAGKNRGIDIKIAQSKPTANQPDHDTQLLAKENVAEVRSLDFKRLLGSGILHTKMWLVDDKHFYLGSANLDWRSLTQVKELGVMVYNCSCLAQDMAKIFDVYWMVGGLKPNATLPKRWPTRDATNINSSSPAEVKFNASQLAFTYLSSSPPPLSPIGREEDINAILKVISDAKRFVYVAVMDFVPMFLYGRDAHTYWPTITDALKSAAIDRRVKIKLMASNWTHTRKEVVTFLQALEVLDGVYQSDVKVKLFTVPSFSKQQEKIPYARVNHNKYMVTDNCAYIGTSNWSADYFVNTGGIGIVVNQTARGEDILGQSDNFRRQVKEVFLRDWNSVYAGALPPISKHFQL